MARIFALLGLCITLYARATASAQPAGAARPVLSSMPKDNVAKPKRKRTVLDMRGKHYLSQRGLSHVCTNIKTHGMVKATSPRTMMRNRSASTNRLTPFGRLIQERILVTKKGGTIKIPFVHPAAMLWVCCEESNEFKMFFSSVLEGQPRLRIAEYTDEVTPGKGTHVVQRQENLGPVLVLLGLRAGRPCKRRCMVHRGDRAVSHCEKHGCGRDGSSL